MLSVTLISAPRRMAYAAFSRHSMMMTPVGTARFASTTASAHPLPRQARPNFFQRLFGRKRQEAPTHIRKAVPHVQQFSPSQTRRRLIAWSVFFAGFSAWAVWVFHSTQIQYTPLFKGIMFTLRQDKQVRRWIGDGITASKSVDGFINHIKGKADFEFDVTGSMGKGRVHLVAERFMEDWFIRQLTVHVAGEEIVHLEPGVRKYPAKQ